MGFQCSSACRKENFPVRKLTAYQYPSLHKTGNYYLEVVTTKFLKEHVILGLLKCTICNYITADNIDGVRKVVKHNTDKLKLRCPCCHSIYSRRTKKH